MEVGVEAHVAEEDATAVGVAVELEGGKGGEDGNNGGGLC